MSLVAPDLARSGSLVAPHGPRVLPVVALALVFGAVGAGMTAGPWRLVLFAAALSLLASVAVALTLAQLAGRRDRVRAVAIAALVGEDAAPCFATDRDGAVCYRNRAAEGRFGPSGAATLIATLGDVFAYPSAVLYRLQSRAATLGAAREDVVTRRGHVRLSVHRVGSDRFLWRLEEIADRTAAAPGRGAEGLSLPMMVASKTGTVLFTNEALRRLLGGRPRTIDRVFTNPDFRSGDEVVIAGDLGPVRALVAEVEGAGERREVYLLPVNDAAARSCSLDDLPVAFVRLAGSGLIRAANRRARELLGLGEAGGMARGAAATNLADLVEGPGRSMRDWIGDMAAGRIPPRTEVLRLRGVDGDHFVQITPQLEDDGDLGAVLTDATAFKTLEAQFVQSQKMQAIGQLAGGVAHDFNNLLTAISGHCDLLMLRHDRTDPDYGDLAQIHQNANRAAALVGQLLAFSRKQTLQPERLDLGDVLSDITHLLNRLVGEKVSLDLHHGGELGAIRADRRQLEQVLVNLVVNARDAMPGGGIIRIATKRYHVATAEVRGNVTLPKGDYAVIKVADTGTGIPEDLHQKVFEPFFTTKKPGEGTGLGLSTAYGIVKQTGGFIFVDSAMGAGTTFTLYFPVHTDPEPAAAPARAPTATPRRGPRPGQGVVLLVEDEAPVRAFASRALRLRGYTVLEADCAEDALRTLEDASLTVDVFVTDVIMPGMDGPSWVRKALEHRPGVRVVFVSGYPEDAVAEAQADIPNAVFLPKPFSLDALTTTVQGQLH